MFYLLFKYATALLILNKKSEIVKDDILCWHFFNKFTMEVDFRTKIYY